MADLSAGLWDGSGAVFPTLVQATAGQQGGAPCKVVMVAGSSTHVVKRGEEEMEINQTLC